MILVIGPHVWAKGETEQEALGEAVSKYGGKLPRYLVYDVHPETYVDQLGEMCYPATLIERDVRPRTVKAVLRGKVIEDNTSMLDDFTWVIVNKEWVRQYLHNNQRRKS